MGIPQAKTVNKTLRVMKYAYAKGYRVTEEGKLLNPEGVERPIKKYGSQRYPTFSVNFEGRPFGIPTHIFAGYCFYGEKPRGLVVRHLNANTLDVSKDNIVYGTHQENALDKPAKRRSEVAKIARASQGKIPNNSKFTEEIVRELRLRMKNGETPASLAREFGVTRTCMCNIKNFKTFKEVTI